MIRFTSNDSAPSFWPSKQRLMMECCGKLLDRQCGRTSKDRIAYQYRLTTVHSNDFHRFVTCAQKMTITLTIKQYKNEPIAAAVPEWDAAAWSELSEFTLFSRSLYGLRHVIYDLWDLWDMGYVIKDLIMCMLVASVKPLMSLLLNHTIFHTVSIYYPYNISTDFFYRIPNKPAVSPDQSRDWYRCRGFCAFCPWRNSRAERLDSPRRRRHASSVTRRLR